MESETDAIRRGMVEAAVERHELLTATNEVNQFLQTTTRASSALTESLSHSLEHLHRKAVALNARGQSWRHERQQCHNATTNHGKLLHLLEAPSLLEEAVRHELYPEALAVLQHIQRATGEASLLAHPAPPDIRDETETAVTPVEVEPERAVLAALRQRTHAALERALFDAVLPRLEGPLTVDAAFRLVQFLRLLIPSDASRSQPFSTPIPRLFLSARTRYMQHLLDEAASCATPAQRVKKCVQAYKLHLHEAVIPYTACFSTPHATEGGTSPSRTTEDRLLSEWCQREGDNIIRAIAGDIMLLQSSYELGLVWEQAFAASQSAGKSHSSLWPVLSALVVDRAMTLFDAQILQTKRDYQQRMQHFSWKTHPHRPNSSSSPTTRRGPHDPSSTPQQRSFADSLGGVFSAANSFNSSTLGGTRMGQGTPNDLIPPTELADFPPLAHLLNGVLHAANSIHRVLLPGMECCCSERLTELLELVAEDLARDGDILAAESESTQTFTAMVHAFGGVLYPYVLQCVVRLFGEMTARRVEEALAVPVTRLERVLQSMQSLQDDAAVSSSPQLAEGSSPNHHHHSTGDKNNNSEEKKPAVRPSTAAAALTRTSEGTAADADGDAFIL